jgi:hypothetical protein
MKKIAITMILFLAVFSTSITAQKTIFSEGYGGTLNLGVGIGGYSGYYGHIGHTLPVLHVDYEFDVARNFTLAPFLNFYSYTDNNYRENVIPIGVKGSLYLDRLLHAGSKWDFYGAGSLGFALVNTTWDANYNGDRTYYHSSSPLFLDLHLGTELHLTNHLGLFLDLSTGVSTFGLAIH